MELFQQTFSMFKPFAPRGAGAADSKTTEQPASEDGNIDDLRRQMKDMQDRLERMSKEQKKEE
jgi:polyhydroxyalkanoate synthesis regulator protein